MYISRGCVSAGERFWKRRERLRVEGLRGTRDRLELAAVLGVDKDVAAVEEDCEKMHEAQGEKECEKRRTGSEPSRHACPGPPC